MPAHVWTAQPSCLVAFHTTCVKCDGCGFCALYWAIFQRPPKKSAHCMHTFPSSPAPLVVIHLSADSRHSHDSSPQFLTADWIPYASPVPAARFSASHNPIKENPNVSKRIHPSTPCSHIRNTHRRTARGTRPSAGTCTCPPTSAQRSRGSRSRRGSPHRAVPGRCCARRGMRRCPPRRSLRRRRGLRGGRAGRRGGRGWRWRGGASSSLSLL